MFQEKLEEVFQKMLQQMFWKLLQRMRQVMFYIMLLLFLRVTA